MHEGETFQVLPFRGQPGSALRVGSGGREVHTTIFKSGQVLGPV